jgi:hypothetical protein
MKNKESETCCKVKLALRGFPVSCYLHDCDSNYSEGGRRWIPRPHRDGCDSFVRRAAPNCRRRFDSMAQLVKNAGYLVECCYAYFLSTWNNDWWVWALGFVETGDERIVHGKNYVYGWRDARMSAIREVKGRQILNS